MAETATKSATKTFNAVSEAAMNVIYEKAVDAKKEVKKQYKKGHGVIKRTRNEMRQKDENAQAQAGYFSGNSNLYCDEPPKQGIVSIIDILKGDVLVNFIAHDSAPLMHIAFDPSGTLLVTADCDGTYLNVYQVIGFPIASQLYGSGHRHDETLYDDDTKIQITQIP